VRRRRSGGGGVSLSLAGWLWADILLGLFAIFLAASAVASAASSPKTGIDRTPLEFRIAVNGAALLASDSSAAATEQQRVASDVAARVASERPGRRVAIVFAYGSAERASDGDRLATLATDALASGAFRGALTKAYHELVAGDPGSAISFEIYFDE
jgi:hypothetical protein